MFENGKERYDFCCLLGREQGTRRPKGLEVF